MSLIWEGSPHTNRTGTERRGHSANWFFEQYNHQHRHSGIGLNNPAEVYHGRAQYIRAKLQLVPTPPTPPAPNDSDNRQAPRIPEATWINPPKPTPLATAVI